MNELKVRRPIAKTIFDERSIRIAFDLKIDMEQEQLIQMFSNSLPLSQEALLNVRTWLKQYPYFQPLRVLLLNHVIHSAGEIEEVKTELSRQLPFVTDKQAMLIHLKADCLGWNRWYDDGEERPSVEVRSDVISLIDSFLIHSTLPIDSMGGAPELSKPIAETPIRQRTIEAEIQNKVQNIKPNIKPTTEPTAESAVIDQYLSFDHHDLRQSFNRSEGKMPSEFTILSESQNEEDDDTLSESLAKIYVKQRKYQKAMELFQALLLKYPNKSVYFADQIRFLRIIIDNIKQN